MADVRAVTPMAPDYVSDWPQWIVRSAALGGGALLLLRGLQRGGGVGAAMMTCGSIMALTGAAPPRVASSWGGAVARRMPTASAHARHAVTIDHPRSALFNFWNDPTNLPAIFPWLDEVRPRDENRSHWRARGPGNALVEWDIEVERSDQQRVAWRSVGGASMTITGIVELRDAPGGRGTEVYLTLSIASPLGMVGKAPAWLTGPTTQSFAREGLRRLKQMIECGGSIPAIDGQPHGQRSILRSNVR